MTPFAERPARVPVDAGVLDTGGTDTGAANPETVIARRLLPAACGAAVLAGVLAGRLAAGSQPMLALLLPLLLLPVLLWRHPTAGILLFVGAIVTIEQFGYEVGPRHGAATANIPFFHAVSAGSGLTPAEVFLALVVAIWLLQTVQRRERLHHPTVLGRQIAWLCGITLLYLVVGIARHGLFKIAMWEIRPFFYLALTYLLAASLLTRTETIRAILWIMVIGSGAKAVYGITIWYSIRHVQPRPEAVLAHEESFFFGLVAILTLGLWVFHIRGRLRVVATTLLPVVLLADMVNSRRTAWAILGTASVVMLVICYVRRPERRKVLRRVALVILAGSAVYLPAFWHKDGTLAQPARAIRSEVAPDARDKESNQYRTVEDANLLLNIQAKHSTGKGFGLPIDYIIGMVDLHSSIRAIAYIPHNGVLYVWMRMGVLGELLLWLVIMHGVVAACRLTGHADNETALFAALVVCASVAWVIMGDKDMGFTWFRIVLLMGVFFGAVEARTRVSVAQRAAAPAPPQWAGPPAPLARTAISRTAI
jgi:O-antigen ligase/polysaccharide polymerase Wzy-like membrane protein